MKLSFEQIKSVTVGALQIHQANDGIHFCKMTAGQVDGYQTPVIFANKGEAITYPLPEGEHRVTIFLPAFSLIIAV